MQARKIDGSERGTVLHFQIGDDSQSRHISFDVSVSDSALEKISAYPTAMSLANSGRTYRKFPADWATTLPTDDVATINVCLAYDHRFPADDEVEEE